MASGDPVVSLLRADGRELVLGNGEPGAQITRMYGAEGLGLGPVSFATSPRLAGNGSVLRGERVDERELFIPVLLEADDVVALDSLRESLTVFLSPLDSSELVVRVTSPGRDEWRELPVRYAGGLEGDFGDGYHGDWQKVGLKFKALDALWRGQPVTITKMVDAAYKPFLSASVEFFPVVLADSTVAGRISVDIAGAAPTLPVWTVTPPGEDLLIQDLSTGARLYLDGLLPGQVTVDMAQGRVTVASTGENLNDRLSLDTRFFALSPGHQEIAFSMVGASSASRLDLTYTPRYLAGL